MKLFKKLAAIYSGSDEEYNIRKYIKRWIRNCVPEATIRIDKAGNMYITKGEAETYPCVVAHLDQVQDPYPSDYTVYETKEIIFAYSPSNRAHCGLGADDKCGIWIALKTLKKHDAIKIAFFPGEEIGCIGSNLADMSFFSDVRFVVEPDRRGSSDLITTIGGMSLCSDDFIKDTEHLAFGYRIEHGLMTDVETLKRRGLNVSCINMSCGYYSPHTENEYVVKKDMQNALDLVDHIITNCVNVYSHTATYSNPYPYSWRWRSKDWYDDYPDYTIPTHSQSFKKHHDSEDDNEEMSDKQLELYYQQYNDAQDYLALALHEDPYISAKEFLADYSSELTLLTVSDIEEIIDRFYDTYDDEYGDNWHINQK